MVSTSRKIRSQIQRSQNYQNPSENKEDRENLTVVMILYQIYFGVPSEVFQYLV